MVKVCSVVEDSLPVGLKLRVDLEFDSDEEMVREEKKFESVQLEFSELPGSTFRVKVSLEGEVITEEFVV